MRLNGPATLVHTRIEHPEGNYLVYKATFPNGKRYFGITRQTFKKRIACHYNAANYGKRTGKGFYAMQRALLKYPKSSVHWEVQAFKLDPEYAKHLEQVFIRVFDSRTNANGYNTSPGGDYAPSYDWTTQRREKRVENFPAFKAFELLTKKEVGEWKCQMQAAEELSLSQANIGRCLQGKTVAHGGFLFCYSNSIHTLAQKFSRAQTNRNREFQVFNKDGELLGNWNSSNQCAKDLNLPTAREIRAVLNEPRRSSYKNLTFKYTEGN